MAEAGALVVLTKATGEVVYLASDRPGRETWVPDRAHAKAFSTLAEASRAALLARRRAGRPQPYAIPAQG